MAATSLVPTRCVERHPTTQTVWFCGTPINLSALGRSFDPPIEAASLSRYFSGQRTPSVKTARLLAHVLGMQLQAFLDGLEAVELGRVPHKKPVQENVLTS